MLIVFVAETVIYYFESATYQNTISYFLWTNLTWLIENNPDVRKPLYVELLIFALNASYT